MAEFICNLKKYRLLKELTQEQLAQRLGIGKAALSMIETGKAALSSRNRNILVQELNVNPDWLETGKGCMFNAEPDLTAYMHRTDNSLPLQSVPLYSIEGTAGLVPLFADQAQPVTAQPGDDLVLQFDDRRLQRVDRIIRIDRHVALRNNRSGIQI